ncbi:MAG: hypothetical protein RQ715_04305 [Methylococcales bacterium]|nr:hypothetical protein [Methylococcales bacterium]
MCLLSLAVLAGCVSTPSQTDSVTTEVVNDYPTQARVDYVLECIARKGGLTYISQYGCSCKLDKLAEKMTFADFEQARTFGFLRKTPGEAGGVFRDPAEAKRLRKLIEAAENDAERSCFVQ